MNTAAPELIALGDSDLILAREDDDIRGRTVRDSSGGEVGEVDDLLIDTQDERVRFLVVASGGFLGIGAEKSYIPVDAVVGVDEEVRVGHSREELAAAPPYDPELVNDRDYNERSIGYFGYTPYWAPGYGYPAYPYYS